MKYSYEQKLSCVLRIVESYDSLAEVSREIGTHPEHLRRWVNLYEAYGEEGLRLKHGSYRGDFKLSVLTYKREKGLSLRETAVRFGIPNESIILSWERTYESEGASGLYRNNRGKMKKAKPEQPKKPPRPLTVEEQLRLKVEFLEAEVAYLKKLRALVEERVLRESGSAPKPSKD